ncbi:MAG: GDSL-type esterase/lipase family protein [Ignavibacteriales bacterium]|nr:MAG: hypothetical protein F9K26_00675 [Ignavibacteriaceae bacterium]MBW7871923.1 hypothetical protein [Ignavibacteria bacterium]MCZ2144226.1 GDSL-type esterase/lipase family protein [Ignavibacteriales bacterium]OQY78847.1 MAG: hypothetical protein B6D45_01695 [Ignavibacteriales bacterium UTCHB3]MBV6446180.1 hypothetical protein [Ignavibacteriaceae bacterium]
MRKYSIQILLGILLINGIILAFSFLGPDYTIVSPINGEKIVISFPNIKEGLFRSAAQVNQEAENILSKYDSSDDPLISEDSSQPEEGTEEHFLINPKVNSGKALDNFFNALKNESGRKIVRVAHYGDSQIEGDRITTSLRELFQREFGGEGIGYVALDDISDNANFVRYNSNNWERFNVFNHAYPPGRYGLSGLVFKFGSGKKAANGDNSEKEGAKKNKKDDKDKKSKKDKNGANEGNEDGGDSDKKKENNAPNREAKPLPDSGSVSLTYFLADSYNYFKRAFYPVSTKVSEQRALRGNVSFNFVPGIRFSKIKVLYGKVGEETSVSINDSKNGGDFATLTLSEAEPFGIQSVSYSGSTNFLRFSVKSNKNPEIFGFLLDGEKGVQVDNFAIRGHSGDGLLKINRELLTAQYEKLNVKLIILQYGMNVMPTVRQEKDLERVRKYYATLFEEMRKRAPNASILVIGPGDMGVVRRGTSVSHPFMARVVELIKDEALKHGCAFWNTYQLMGGENSINIWTQKGYAARDGHFINKGQKVIANELFNGINNEYKKFLQTKTKTKSNGNSISTGTNKNTGTGNSGNSSNSTGNNTDINTGSSNNTGKNTGSVTGSGGSKTKKKTKTKSNQKQNKRIAK